MVHNVHGWRDGKPESREMGEAHETGGVGGVDGRRPILEAI